MAHSIIRFFLCLLLAGMGSTYLLAQSLPKPTAAQLQWHNTEFYLFIHFGPNTFTNVEWGHGTEIEDVFLPTALDCDQWCTVAKQAGAKGIVITAKHHDGFCLWPSQYSNHTVRESRWKDGKGDVLQELSDACKRHGLLLGLYLSPWDRNHPQYGTESYNDVYVQTMTELMTRYGPLFEFWWDGACGEGPNGKKQVYDFHRFEREAARLQPNAVVFSDIGPGCRWAGNERGTITATNWCTLDTVGFKRGEGAPPTDTLQQGNVNGFNWIPAECDVSIRPGWFYHEEEDDRVKTPEQLWNIYLNSVGHGANLILNVPPDRRGRIHARDSAALVAFGQLKTARFAHNMAYNKRGYAWSKPTMALMDSRLDTYEKLPKNKDQWEITIDFGHDETISMLKIQEHITHGQKIAAFVVEALDGMEWKEISRSTTIGPRKILTFDPVKTMQMRIRILAAKGPPEISEVAVY